MHIIGEELESVMKAFRQQQDRAHGLGCSKH